MKINNLEIQENVSLASLTAFKIGGLARYYAIITSVNELETALTFAREQSLPFFVLGEGSNVLISDEGYAGLILSVDIRGMNQTSETETHIILKVGAGETWDDVCRESVLRGLWGLENLSLIPGKTGGVPIQNIGAYGAEAKQVVMEIEVFDTRENRLISFQNSECAFRYRTSRFNDEDKGRFIVLNVVFMLAKNGTPNMNYPDVKKYFEAKGILTPTLKEMRQAIVDIRTYKLPDPKVLGNAGSFFKNPIVGKVVFEAAEPLVIRERAMLNNCCYDPWHWAQPDGSEKISAACIMHLAGYVPGTRAGRVGIAPRQPLVLVNYENGNAADIIAFANEIRRKVHEKVGIELQTEPELVGFSTNPFPALS